MNKVIVFLIAAVLIAPLTISAQVQGISQQASPKISNKEFKHLLKHAQTAADQQRIAMYYRHKAERLNRESKDEEELADAYANHTLFEPKTAHSGGLVLHCRELAAYDAKSAKEATALAAEYEKSPRLRQHSSYDRPDAVM